VLLDRWGDGRGHEHEVLARRLRGVLLGDRVRTEVAVGKVLIGDSAIVHIEHVKLLFLCDNEILMVLLCHTLIGVPVIGLV